MVENSPTNGAYCQGSGSEKTFFGGKGGRDLDHELMINSSEQTSFFCNDKSGFSMVEAMQGIGKRLDSSGAVPLPQDTYSPTAPKNKDWILNSGLLDSKEPDLYDPTAYESNG